MNEEWRDVGLEPFNEVYQVSNFGRVVRKDTGSFLYGTLNNNGYRAIVLSKGAWSYRTTIHRLVAKTFVENDNPTKYDVVNHIDGNKINNYASNLEWTDYQGNTIHAIKTGLMVHGQNHPFAKMTDEEVEYVRKVYKPRDKEFGATALAKKFGVTQGGLSDILCGKSRGKIRNENVKSNISKEDKQFIIDNHTPRSSKFGTKAMATRFNITTGHVSKILKDNGIQEKRVKLTEKDVRWIKENYNTSNGLTTRELAKMFGVGKSTIFGIVSGLRRADVV